MSCFANGRSKLGLPGKRHLYRSLACLIFFLGVKEEFLVVLVNSVHLDISNFVNRYEADLFVILSGQG